MKILVLGSGGREHAILWKLKLSPMVDRLYCAPGNPGTARIAESVPINPLDPEAVATWVTNNGIDLTIVGPEAPLAVGIVDLFEAHGLRIMGPTRAAAQLETSKAFAKDFMKRHRIPTAEYATFTAAQSTQARDYLRLARYPLVLKADGLAAGKGVFICQGFDEAGLLAEEMLSGLSFGDAGRVLVVEEFLHGIEASVFALTDGIRFATLAPAQDHKRILDGDKGKNTGGMGAYAPTPYVPTTVLSEIKLRVIKPVIDGMMAEGYPFRGVLFVGVMITEEGPKVLEFNCRFGDPETQVILPLIDADFAELMMGIAIHHLPMTRIPQHDANAVCVVMAANGYPDAYEKGKVISGLDSINETEEGVFVFHAGTARIGDAVVTAGGRVLGVTAVGPGKDFAQTINYAYHGVQRIRFDGAYYRMDIGRRALDWAG